ncbi:unnamed protein product [Peniophora sp. CBMAI 1063]|nr:unnamed protein product [Peniophora sp. CBMAI 1063]
MAFETLELEDFAYDTDGTLYPSESPLSYYPGGLHPVTMGTIISSAKTRYHVVHKLGHGGYATVWLVQDLSSSTWLALRIRMARCDGAGEDEVLHSIRSKPGSPHLPDILDVFTIDGPNGRHTAIVTDVIAPLGSTLAYVPEERMGSKSIVRGIVEAVAHLHGAGIIHGDLHVGNIGLAMDLRKAKVKPIAPLRCPVRSEARVTLLIAETPRALAQSSHFPPYIVQATDLGPHYEDFRDETDTHVVKVFDFGNAHLTERPRPTGGFLKSIAPPEWEIVQSLERRPEVFFTMASDVWALGLLMFGVMSGGNHHLLPGHSSQLLEMAQLAGSIPSSWNSYPAAKTLNSHDVSARSADDLWQRHRTALCESGLIDEDAGALIALLRRIMVLEPSARPSAAQILRDPWFSIVAKITDRGEVQVASPGTRYFTDTAPNYAHPVPSAPIQHTNSHGMAHHSMYPSQNVPFAPQPPTYQPPPPVHPAIPGYPSPPHIAPFTYASPFPPTRSPVGSEAWVPPHA